ncbi:MAG TPA: type II secretion system F family protein [Bacteriovoracaceae bacterium]|nr:type II secretion system F family protein [Bacteriovoracaceae bacterium]
MRKILQSLCMLLGLMLPAVSAWSQCAPDFNRIDSKCILTKTKEWAGNIEGTKFTTEPIRLNEGMNNDIFFYNLYEMLKDPADETKSKKGNLIANGKLKVVGTTVAPLECTLLIDAVTFTPDGKSYIPNSSLSISVDNNHWLKNKIFMDRGGQTALEMERTYNRIKHGGSKEVLPVGDKPGSKEVKPDAEKAGEPDYCYFRGTAGLEIARYRKEEAKIKDANNLLYFAPLVLVFIAIFLIVNVFMQEQEKFKTSEALEEAENTNKGKPQPLFLKITKPFYKRYFLPMVMGFKNKQALKTKYRQKLANAGMLKEMSPEEFMALKIFMILGGPFAFLTVRYILEESWTLSITPIMGVIGYFYPNIWLNGMIANRATMILRAMPFIVDMLALSVEAGLDFMAAISRVIEKAPPSPLVEEFETLIKETKIGSSRAEGLRQMGWRINIIEINSFCATLIAADSVGASIAPILKQLSGELRVKRSSRAEQQGATAATKILIPMIFFILPAVLVAIFAPMILKMMAGKI